MHLWFDSSCSEWKPSIFIMSLTLVASEILESVLTMRTLVQPIATGPLPQDELTVSLERKQVQGSRTDAVYVINFSAVGSWTRTVATKNFTDYCPSLLSLIHERQTQNQPPPIIRWTLVTESYKESHTLLVDHGCLNISQERVPRTPNDPQPALHIILECDGNAAELDQWSSCVKTFMYKLKLVHPSMVLHFKSSNGDLKDFSLEQERFGSNTIDTIQMITDSRYFMQLSGADGVHLGPIRPVSGGSFLVPCPPLPALQLGQSLKCVVVAHTIPPLLSSHLQASSCSQIWLSMYGPGSFPLARLAGSPREPRIDLRQLANWEDLGLSLANQEERAEPDSQSQPIAGLQEEFTPDERVLLAGGRSSADPCHEGCPHVVHLMVFFQETCPETTSVQARQDLLSWVRQDFPHICAQQSSKLRKIIHDTIAKLYGNMPLRKDREATVSLAIPACASAICDIVSHSSNDVFRQRCLQAMQATDTRELSEKLCQGLASLTNRPHDQLLPGYQRRPLSQPQFPDRGVDEDGGHRALDGTNLASQSPQHTPQQNPLKGLLPQPASDEDKDFDLLDKTGPDCLSSLLQLPSSSHAFHPSSIALHPPPQTLSSLSSSTLSTVLSSKIASSSVPTSMQPQSLSLPSPSKSTFPEQCVSEHHLHDNPRPPMKPGEPGEACEEEVQMMQEVLREEVGGDWFESLTGPHDWLSREL